MSEHLPSEEKVDVCGDGIASRLILNAMSTFINDKDFTEKFGGNGRIVTVELKVNGHSVPVVDTLVKAWEQCEEKLDSDARKLALKMVTEAGLEPIAAALRDAERMIRDRLKNYDYE